MSVNGENSAGVGNGGGENSPAKGSCPPCSKKSNSNKFISLTVAALATVGLILLIWNVAQRQIPLEVPPVIHPVKSVVVKPANDDLVLMYPGSTRSYQQVDIGFQVAGTLVDLPINSGKRMFKGDVIARLDPTNYQNTLDARIADYQNAKATYERVDKLYKAEVYSKSTWDEAAAQMRIAKANVDIAQKDRNDCTLKAPYDGIIAKRYVDNFQTVTTGQPIISLQDISTLEVQVDFPEWLVSQARKLENNAKAYAVYDSMPDVKIPLNVREFSAEADPQTRTYPVRFYMVHNPDKGHVNILPGMTANVYITIKHSKDTKPYYVLPVWSVVSNAADNKPYVFVIDTKKKPWVAHKRLVTVGQMTGESIVVTEGLKPGEHVAIAGADRMDDGMKVTKLPEFLEPTFHKSDESTEMGEGQQPADGAYDSTNTADGELEADK